MNSFCTACFTGQYLTEEMRPRAVVEAVPQLAVL
jgi:hypothetical protein